MKHASDIHPVSGNCLKFFKVKGQNDMYSNQRYNDGCMVFDDVVVASRFTG